MIIGAGPTGVKAANQLLKKSDELIVKIFNGEPAAPYNRAQLSYYLAGDVGLAELDNHLPAQSDRLFEFDCCRIEHVDTDAKIVLDQYGHEHGYDKLIIATGSLVTPPSIAGNDKSGVYCFRSLSDAQALLKRREDSQNVFVIGSGPLGIETALAMKTLKNRVFLQVRNSLFARDLDANAKGVLADYIRSNGVEIIDDAAVQRIHGNGRVNGVLLTDGRELAIDTVIMCTGVSPFKQLASDAGIDVARGILVDDFMRTNCDGVYAVGECAEHNGVTHGLISPGYEQAEVCVNHIVAAPTTYSGRKGELQFKFRDFSSHLLGDTNEQNRQVLVYKNTLKNVYRKLVLDGRCLVGAVIIGEWDEAGRVASCIAKRKKLSRSATRLFLERGKLWNDEQLSILEQPEEYIVCLCKNVTRGEVSECMKKGFRTLPALGQELEAGITCGSCQPLLSAMLKEPRPNLIMRHYRAIFWASVFSVLVIAITFFAPKLPFERSVQFAFQFEKIWYGSIYKQTTGYILLALIALSGALSLRKRWKILTLGNLDNWRFAHTILGLVALVALIVHTGFRLGENLSFVLMVVFLLATLTGSLVGVFMSRNHHWTDLKLTQYRAWWSRVHYGLLWLLPALLSFHIVSSYYFS
ncbi:nitrite reductase (NADH) large subunit [Arenicella xantha]|uniref:Nitrite reductase (NADH) large subunit n=1 Tax=Arenicella xantha TaxID=644221 RepID=A0A395JRN2_9GAMM|nr:nitrite reductase (NADH) large subunit [Arenicella xantha]